MQSSIIEELEGLDLGDKRLEARAFGLLTAMAASPGVGSIAGACGDRAATKAAYRFLANDNVSHADLLAPHIQKTFERASEYETVLAPEDTTSIDFTGRAMEGIGHLENKKCKGLFVHTAMLVTTSGIPLGVAFQQIWGRAAETLGITKERRQRDFLEKESARWAHGEDAVAEAAGAGRRIVVVADREGDIFEWLARPRQPNVERLVRARHDRLVVGGGKLLSEVVGDLPILGTRAVEVGRADERPARTAAVVLRAGPVELPAPRLLKNGSRHKPALVWVVSAQELAPPAGQKALHWVLLASWEIADEESARNAVEWYSHRWMLERFHYVLKSGCQVEKLQLESAQRVSNALALHSITAWRLLWLTLAARQMPEESCELVLQPYEWKALCIHVSRHPIPPSKPPTMREAIRMIACLGGFLARKVDKEPGVKVLWRGLVRFEGGAEMYRLLTHPDNHPNHDFVGHE